jgi:hypothetical protein
MRKLGACHLFRHTMGTLMLEPGLVARGYWHVAITPGTTGRPRCVARQM